MAKPKPDHPWILRTNAQVRKQRVLKQKRAKADVFEQIRADEEAHEREEASEIERQCREFFYP